MRWEFVLAVNVHNGDRVLNSGVRRDRGHQRKV